MSRTHLFTGLGVALITLSTGVIAATPVQDAWDSVFIAGVKVGSIHSVVEPYQGKLRVRIDLALRLKRLNATTKIQMRSTTIETRDGFVESLDTSMRASDQELHVFGTAKNGRMTLTIQQGAGPQQQQTIAWGPEVRGPYAVEQSLAREPIQAGSTRTLTMFQTDLNRLSEVTLTAAKEPEEVPLSGGAKRSLLRVEQTTTVDGKPRPEFDMTLWVDPKGDILKASSDNLGGMVTFRTTRQLALAPADGAVPFDQVLNSIIKVASPIARPSATRDITYRITLKDADPAQLIPADRRQSLKPGGAKNSAILEVKTAGPDAGEPGSEPPGPEFLRPNAMIDSTDAKVIELAHTAVGETTEPWEKAVRIETWVAENLKDKNFSVAFAPASEVARNLSGDCTEHGVLTAAMCRASGVPARVVIGLVYAEPLGGFGYHLWNEVYVNRRWVAVDAAYHQSSVDAVHIKLSDSSLDGVAPFEAFLPVVRVLGKMTLTPVEVR